VETHGIDRKCGRMDGKTGFVNCKVFQRNNAQINKHFAVSQDHELGKSSNASNPVEQNRSDVLNVIWGKWANT
ncbi:MAG: hypothetical protein ACREOZ_01160, partial [Gloeomargaritales cyanobacterium]